MNETYNKQLKPYAQKLRREMTPDEKHLWYDFFKHLPCTVKRQKIIGRYIADFYIPSAKIVIELDGMQHYEEAAQQYDRARDAFFVEKGMMVLRFSNVDLYRHFPSVCETILHHLHARNSVPFA